LLLPPIGASRLASQPVEKPLASDIRTFFIFFFGKAEGDGDEEREEELAATFFDSLLGSERLRRFGRRRQECRRSLPPTGRCRT
jgi:hypothetical protein